MCRALQDAGIDVLVATTDADLDVEPLVRLESVTSYKALPFIFFKKQSGNSFKYSRPFSRWLDQNVRNYDVVHIHAVFNHSCIAAARACRKRNVPYIVRPLGTLDPWGMKQKSFRKALFWQTVGKRMLRDAAAVHYTALAEQKGTEQSLGLNHGQVVPLGVETNNFNPSLDDEAFKREFPELREHPYILVLSRLLPTKGLDVLLEAFLSLVKQAEFRDWRLVLAGVGPVDYVGTLQKKVDSHNARHSVLFPGWVGGERKEAILARASLLALPSHHENFGLCVLEALARSVPVLVSPHVNLAPEIEAAGAGWVVPVEAKALEAALAHALNDDRTRKQFGLAARNLSLRFSWSGISAQLVKLYSSVSAPQQAGG
jgi:glycosyltransferase involved in cell wall biosynthesis